MTSDQQGHVTCDPTECGCHAVEGIHQRTGACHPGVVDPEWRRARHEEVERLLAPPPEGEGLSYREAGIRMGGLSPERIRHLRRPIERDGVIQTGGRPVTSDTP